jgi:hypothetical protein
MEYVVKVPAGLREPKWSTDGTLLAAQGRGGVFVHDPSSRKTSLAASGYIWEFVWLPGCKLVYDVRKDRLTELHLLDARKGTDKKLLSIPSYDLYQLRATNDGRVVFTNRGRYSEWKADIVDTSGGWTPIDDTSPTNLVWYQEGPTGQDEIWIRNDGTTREIPVGKVWLPIMPSPHGDYLAIQVEVDRAVRTVVITNRGERITALPLGFMASQWASNDQAVVGAETRDDGDTIGGSKLAIFDVRAGAYEVIATPPDQIPMDPTWHSGTGRLAFEDYRTGSLVVGLIQKNSK